MTLRKITPIGFTALALLSVTARGAVDPHSVPFGPTPVNSPQFSLVLPKFDSTLGTLTSVTFTLSATTSGGSFAFDNEGPGSGSVGLSFGVSAQAQTGIMLLTTVVDPLFTTTGSGNVAADNDGAPDFVGSDSFHISGNGSNTQSVVQTASNYLTQFTATPSAQVFLARIDNSVNTLLTGTTGTVFGPTSVTGGTFSGIVTVSYTYFLVPVPEAVTTLWGACIGLFALGRRKRVRQS